MPFRLTKLNLKPYLNSFKPYNLTYTTHYFCSQKTTPPTIPQAHHYQTLNITPDTSIDDIKKSYNKLLKQWHPDLYQSKSSNEQNLAQSKFMQIRQSYQIIIDYKTNPPKIEQQQNQTNINEQQTSSFYSFKQQKSYTNQQSSTISDEDESREKFSSKISYYDTLVYKIFSGLKLVFWGYWFQNPSYLRLIVSSILGLTLIRFIYLGYINPSLNAIDPDRLWTQNRQNSNTNNIEFNKYQPTSANAMNIYPNFKKLQPHFAGKVVYSDKINNNKINRNKNENNINKNDLEIIKINMNNGKKKKINKKIKGNRVVIDDIPKELRDSPVSVLMAGYAAKNGKVKDGDWSQVINEHDKQKKEPDIMEL